MTDDAPAIADAVQAPLAGLGPWMPWATADDDDASARMWIDASDEDSFLIVDADDAIVGACGFNGHDPWNRRANLGDRVRPSVDPALLQPGGGPDH